MQDAAKGGMMEVAMGRVAEKNATDSEVKNYFGARMVKDHGKANDELKALAKEENSPSCPRKSNRASGNQTRITWA